jgi:hypothetical protein
MRGERAYESLETAVERASAGVTTNVTWITRTRRMGEKWSIENDDCSVTRADIHWHDLGVTLNGRKARSVKISSLCCISSTFMPTMINVFLMII